MLKTKSDTCTGCRYLYYDVEQGVHKLPIQESTVLRTFRCVCPHPATCYDQNDLVEQFFRGADGSTSHCLMETGCEHFTPIDNLLWESEKSAEAWVEKVLGTNDIQNAARIISEKLNSLIVPPDSTLWKTGETS